MHASRSESSFVSRHFLADLESPLGASSVVRKVPIVRNRRTWETIANQASERLESEMR